jgi:hypothetical protein
VMSLFFFLWRLLLNLVHLRSNLVPTEAFPMPFTWWLIPTYLHAFNLPLET